MQDPMASDGMSSGKEGDAYLIVSQNNQKRQVKVKESSDAVAVLLGRMPQEMEGALLQDILGKRAKEAVDDYLEYEADAPDLQDVLSRVQDFKLTHYNGEEIPFALKIFRDQARDFNDWFRMLLKDERRKIQENSFMEMLQRNMAGVCSLEEKTGLPDRYSAQQYIELVQKYVRSHGIKVCFAVIRVDRWEKSVARYGKEPCVEQLRHVANCCKSMFRDNDVVCCLSEKAIGLFLFNIPIETARVVISRMRSSMGAHRIAFGGKPDFAVTVSVSFMPISADESRDILTLCEDAIVSIDQDERGTVIELEAE